MSHELEVPERNPFYVAMAIYRTSDRSQHPKVDGWGQPQHLCEYVHVFLHLFAAKHQPLVDGRP